MYTVSAYAKLNLSLELTHRRSDGYHEIVSVIQTIGLQDTLNLSLSDEISFVCSDQTLQTQENLVVKAANSLLNSVGGEYGASIKLDKRIPVASGFGGGSSDAAATLIALNILWELNVTKDELKNIGLSIGSDVPYFIDGGTAMIGGRGNIVRRLPNLDIKWFLLVIPDFQISDKTANAYRHIQNHHFTNGGLTRKLEARLRSKGDLPPQLIYNTFDNIASELYPELQSYWDALRSVGAKEIHLAGSGPSIYTPVRNKEIGTAMELLLKYRHGLNVVLAQSVYPECI